MKASSEFDLEQETGFRASWFKPINQRLGCACANIASDSWAGISQLGSLSQLRAVWDNPVNQISAEEN